MAGALAVPPAPAVVAVVVAAFATVPALLTLVPGAPRSFPALSVPGPLFVVTPMSKRNSYSS